MTTTPATAKSSLNARIAAEIRAEMGRQGMVNAQLARTLGVSEAWTTRRLSLRSADTPLAVADIERICDILGVSVLEIVKRASDNAPNERSERIPRTAPLTAPAGRVHPPTGHRSADVASGISPSAPHRRDSTRPQSAVPATERRPKPSRPPARPMAA